ncbi:MAG TPA: nuclear transport factor 2 family protein [Candidatus Limnocylindrales bacterium]
MDRDGFAAWLDRYVSAWRTYDPVAIGDLFSADVTYRYHPEDEPVTGRAAIVADWLSSPDDPASWRSRYEPFAVEGDRAVMRGSTEYVAADGETVERRFYNVWVCLFDADGRCRDFTEYYMEPRRRAATTVIDGSSAA